MNNLQSDLCGRKYLIDTVTSADLTGNHPDGYTHATDAGLAVGDHCRDESAGSARPYLLRLARVVVPVGCDQNNPLVPPPSTEIAAP